MAPRFLHIATHGFYLADVKPPAGMDFTRGIAGIATGMTNPAALPVAHVADPLLRSGLVFSGANSKDGAARGIATARELCGMNLWGTELVVLSACETGLGGVTSGDGVLGLRRSFLQSGARTLITSMWRIPDAETRDLMVEFYRRKLAGNRTATALREATLEIRKRLEAKGRTHPFYWGGFILVGDPN